MAADAKSEGNPLENFRAEGRFGAVDQRGNAVKTLVAGMLAVGLAPLAFVGGHQTSARGATPAASAQLDLEIAVDGTASMASAIAQARQSGVGITAGILQLLPDTRFSVVAFRDHGNPAGEYQLVQPFTKDEELVKSAFGRIETTHNPSPDNGPAESYNLAFRNSYSDNQMGWRPNARKIVLVLGDAEPNGVGTEGIAGCHDRSHDPEGLSTRRELANMRAAHRTLIMVREHSKELSVSLQCYQSLAAGAYPGGLAEDAAQNLVSTIVELIEGAYAPLALQPDLQAALRKHRSGYTMKLQNPNLLPLTTKSINVQLPRGFRYVRGTTTGATGSDPLVSGRLLTWSLRNVIGSEKQLRMHFAVQTPNRLGTYRSNVSALVETAAGNRLVARTPAAILHVKGQIRTISFAFTNTASAGAAVVGRASARFPGGSKALSRRVAARGFTLLREGHGVRLKLRATRLKVDRLSDPTRAHLTLRIVGVHGLPACHVGSSVTMLLFNSTDLRQDGSNEAYVRLALPLKCGGTVPRAAAAITISDA